jgi:hypothetical protein
MASNDRSVGGYFREAFRRTLLDKLPSWERYIANRGTANEPIEIQPENWDGPPFRIDFRFDTVTVYPMCDGARRCRAMSPSILRRQKVRRSIRHRSR